MTTQYVRISSFSPQDEFDAGSDWPAIFKLGAGTALDSATIPTLLAIAAANAIYLDVSDNPFDVIVEPDPQWPFVEYVAQTLSDAQKTQARENIGAIDTGDFVPVPTGATDGYVATVVSGEYVPQVPTDVTAAAVAAVNTYLAANPPGNIALTDGYMSLGGNGNYAQAPDTASIRAAVNDLDIRFYGSLGSLTGTGFQTLVAKQVVIAGVTTTAFMVRETAAGKLQFTGSADGTTLVNTTASVVTPAGNGYCIQRRKSDGRIQAFVLDPAGSVTLTDDGYGTKWTQIGANVNEGTTNYAIYSGGVNPPTTIGAVANGTSSLSAGSKVGKVVIRNGLNGTIVADPNFDRDLSDITFADGEANVWTLAGTAANVTKKAQVTKNALTVKLATTGDVQSATGGAGWARRNPLTKKFFPWEYGTLGSGNDSPMLNAAILAAFNAGGGIVDCGGYLMTLGADPSVLDSFTGLPYAAIHGLDNVTVVNLNAKLANGANCHMVAHNGRLNNQTPKMQDNIKNFAILDSVLDGNKANQDGCHDHDALHFPQYPGLIARNVRIINPDGHGYYSSANGDFAQNFSDIGTSANATVVKPLFLHEIRVDGAARWGFMMSATNRKTDEAALYATNCGFDNARVAGKKPNPVISADGTLVLTIDNPNAAVINVALKAGDTLTTSLIAGPPQGIITKINNALASTTAVAAASTGTNRLMITSGTAGGSGWVGINGTTTASILTDLGLLAGSSRINGENNASVGGNEYGGFYADHSEANGYSWNGEGNKGVGAYIHNVVGTAYDKLKMVANRGLGIIVNEWVSSGGGVFHSAMNCTGGAVGYASWLPQSGTIASGAATTTPIPKVETLFLAGTVGYGATKDTYLSLLMGPGQKATFGNAADNRFCNGAYAVEYGVDSTFVIGHATYGDGGLNVDGLGANARDYR